MDITQFKKMFEPHFVKYVEECMREMDVRLQDPLLKKLVRQAAKIALAGGKRARPFLVYSMYTFSGGKNNAVALRIALSVEMFHIFCLIHDDITDRGTVRHGQMTIHECAKKEMRKAQRGGDIEHIAHGQAMLVGDLMYAWAYERIAGLKGVEEGPHQEALKVFTDALQDVIAGQMIDVDLTTRAQAPDALILKKMELKTASYTFIRPLELGATLAGASAEVRAFCREFGLAMGVAFQLQDDVLDVIGTEKILGKKPMGDIREGQHTLISQYAFVHASPQERKILTRTFGNAKLSPEDALRVRTIFERTGALVYVEEKITEGFLRAEQILAHAPLKKEAKNVLMKLLCYIQKRAA